MDKNQRTWRPRSVPKRSSMCACQSLNLRDALQPLAKVRNNGLLRSVVGSKDTFYTLHDRQISHIGSYHYAMCVTISWRTCPNTVTGELVRLTLVALTCHCCQCVLVSMAVTARPRVLSSLARQCTVLVLTLRRLCNEPLDQGTLEQNKTRPWSLSDSPEGSSLLLTIHLE